MKKLRRPFGANTARHCPRTFVSCTKTGYVGLDTNLSSSSASIAEPSLSWLTITMYRTETEDETSCPKTSYQLLQSLWRDITGNAQLGTEERALPFKTRRIRLCPTKAQKQILNDWFHTAMWTYNQCLNAIETIGESYLGDICAKDFEARLTYL